MDRASSLGRSIWKRKERERVGEFIGDLRRKKKEEMKGMRRRRPMGERRGSTACFSLERNPSGLNRITTVFRRVGKKSTSQRWKASRPVGKNHLNIQKSLSN